MPSAGDPRPIGVFDSGVGGLTVLAELSRRLPDESTVYLGDNGRAPYGPRTGRRGAALHARVRSTGCSAQDVKLLVLACNTATAHALPLVRAQSLGAGPRRRAPGCRGRRRRHPQPARRRHRDGRHRRRRARTRRPSSRRTRQRIVAQLACPELVPMVEAGIVDGRRAESVLRAYLEPLLAAEPGIDTLLLGLHPLPAAARSIERIVGRRGGGRRLRVHHGPRHRGPARRARLSSAGGLDARPPGRDDRRPVDAFVGGRSAPSSAIGCRRSNRSRSSRSRAVPVDSARMARTPARLGDGDRRRRPAGLGRQRRVSARSCAAPGRRSSTGRRSARSLAAGSGRPRLRSPAGQRAEAEAFYRATLLRIEPIVAEEIGARAAGGARDAGGRRSPRVDRPEPRHLPQFSSSGSS